MNKKEIVGAWIEEVKRWMREIPGLESGTRTENPSVDIYNNEIRSAENPSIGIYIDRLRKAVDNVDAEHAWKYIDRLKRLIDEEGYSKLSINPSIKDRRPEIVLECALAAYALQDIREAKNLLRSAGGIFHPYSLEKVFALWLRGCFLWTPPISVGEAVYYWEESLKNLLDIINRKNFEGVYKEWFLNLRIQMGRAIRDAARDEYPPAPSAVRIFKFETNQPASDVLARSIPVIGSIPAGSPKGFFPESEMDLSFRDIYLDDKKYKAYSIRKDKRVIEIKQGAEYYVLRVIGDSMNISQPVNILSGNYVLLKRQDIAKNGDIVAAEIVSRDNRATLKRYLENGSKHILQSESNITDFTMDIDVEYEFQGWGRDVFLRGVVVAVLKPV